MKALIIAVIIYLLSTICAIAADGVWSPKDKLSGDALAYYIRRWNAVLSTAKSGEIKTWDAKIGKGNIVAGEEYISKSKALCRDYSESFNVGEEKGTYRGTACKMDDADKGWCRLSSSDAKTCAFLEEEDIGDKIVNGAKNLWPR